MLGGLDLALFFGCMFAVMAVGLIAGRKEDTSEDYFLAGRSIPWWGVAGSIFGTNISANHLVGMLGIGFSIGFAQAHFELGAIPALMVLGYVFLPVYLSLGIYTLSQYLGIRFGTTSQLLYSVMVMLLIVVQMTAAFYIGSRALNLLLEGSSLEMGYAGGIVFLVVVTSAYTIFGGLKAVVWTDVIQSALLLFAGILVAVLTFYQDEVGGWFAMLAHDAASDAPKMRMYLPSDHPDLPWSGTLTGLMALHVYFWGTNQYLVQRALAASSIRQARLGIVAGGTLKLLVPFFSIAGGVAAAQLFAARGLLDVAPDDAFPTLVAEVVPLGYGIVGLIAAGLMGAIISSIDSMMNSAATLFTLDIYKKHINPDADEKALIRSGRYVIVGIVVLAAMLAVTAYDPDSQSNFFLVVSRQGSYFTPGLVSVFLMGMFYTRATGKGAALAIALSPVFALGSELLYNHVLADVDVLHGLFGAKLNFMHRTFVALLLCMGIQRLLAGENTADQRKGTWREAGGDIAALKRVAQWTLAVLVVDGLLGVAVYAVSLNRWIAGGLASAATLGAFLGHLRGKIEGPHWKDDRVLSGALCAAMTLVMFIF